MKLVACNHSEHASAILDILNYEIVHSTSLYDYQPRPLSSMEAWFKSKAQGNFPVIGAIDESGQLMGFASYGTFRAWPAYKYTVEHSVYVHKTFQGRGVGSALMRELITQAQKQQFHVMVGGIDLNNTSSIKLHEKLGFNHAGTIKQAGFKFGRWLDLAFYQLVMETPRVPNEG